MAQDKVTKRELREMYVGQTRIFTLKERKKISSARVTATHLKHEEGLEFSVKPDWDASAVSITRIN